MSKTSIGFVIASLIYLAVGVALGVLFFIVPEMRVLRSVHVHLNVVGFVTFMIFGVAYHILPRFRGKPLHSEPLAWVQFWLANIGLIGLLVSMTLYQPIAGLYVIGALFAAILALSIYLFIYNMARTLI
ncbi:hypothetical protein HKBW3S42_00235 [Candidatus Hakubella thermalkaliphila]|uniref:Cytochrome c oxidase cbb3-type subunit I n=1 Tax=Candidatus Hakubella thermalkaliphila TaxID=2754717 RepID=A0A6V8PGV1_9ACTN|nr:hypothetical protein HKBW3S42_00235 [Candidatus Hakubella thermalkaliphila]GFP42204.1 hypothetical protein HKBW3C_01330 [Candidatus Hakubella thermalkaliphila]